VEADYLKGMNYWACLNLAADDSAGGNYSRLVTELDQMAAKGINHLRIMASSEGAPTPQPFRMNPALMDAPRKYNEVVFKGLDVCLDEMSKRGMRATMTLNNEWQWSGGFAQYVSWAQNNTMIPYPSSWNLSAPPQRELPGTGWGNYTTQGVDAAPYNDFTEFANLIYNNTQAEAWYKDHIKTVLSRRNTVNGRWYTEDPAIMTWQLANEPQPSDPKYGPDGFYLDPNPDDLLFPWVDRISSYIRAMAPKQLISVGLESKQGEYYFKQVHNFSTVDYATTHCWVQNWNIYDMYNSSIENLQKAQNFARDFMHNSSRWGADIGKPVFLEEFGMARDNWENVEREYPYLSSASTSHKDAYFQTIIGAVMDEFRNGGAYVGTSPWAYGGIYRPETQVANKFGK
jgi:mannan endo-1,4-beta-mannosidase